MIIDFDLKRFVNGDYIGVQINGYNKYGIERLYYIGDDKKGDIDISIYGLIYYRDNPKCLYMFGWNKEGKFRKSFGDFKLIDNFFDLKLEVANTGENKNSSYLYIENK